MLNSNGSKIKTYVGDDGAIHFTDWTGADTVLNFSSGAISKVVVVCTAYCTWSYDSRTCSSQQYTITATKNSNGEWSHTTSKSGAGYFQVGSAAAGCYVYQKFRIDSITIS